MSELRRFRVAEEERAVDLTRDKVEEIFKRAYEMVEKVITAENARRMLFTRYGTLQKKFPSKKIREWALRKQEEYGLPHGEILSQPLLYEAMRRIYKELEFDVGRNWNIGWAMTTRLGIEDGLRGIVAGLYGKKTAWEIWSEFHELREKYADKIINHCKKVAEELRKQLTGGISYGALAWHSILGFPEMRFFVGDKEGMREVSFEEFQKYLNEEDEQ